MSEFEKWHSNSDCPERFCWCEPAYAMGAASRGPEVAELKRELAENESALRDNNKAMVKMRVEVEDLHRQLSKARDAALVEVKEILLSKNLTETGQLAAIRLIVLPQPDLTPAEIQGGQEIHRLRQGKEKG